MNTDYTTQVVPGITLTCMAAECKDALDSAMELCPHADRLASIPDGFLHWLLQSRIVTTPFDAEAILEEWAIWLERLKQIRCPEDVVYSFAYWLIRYSGLVNVVEQD